MLKYDKLFSLLEQKGISQNKLCDDDVYGISRAQLNRLKHNKIVYTSTLDRVLKYLGCDSVTEILEFVNEDLNKQ
ncbi:helix-turn-helix domain-containing protein [Hungatella effluvii]|uniref:helix-turn-helix domain-containing protein n=1 Tax=Hungatella effluvii TaxID=1096246 RepID=UPI003D80DA0B